MPETKAFEILEAAAESGVTFIDTADVYGLGRSEELIGAWLKTRNDRDRFFIATKLGRFPKPGWPGNFSAAAVRGHVEASLQRLGCDALDLTQTHCVPLEALQTGDVRDAFGAETRRQDQSVRPQWKPSSKRMRRWRMTISPRCK